MEEFAPDWGNNLRKLNFDRFFDTWLGLGGSGESSIHQVWSKNSNLPLILMRRHAMFLFFVCLSVCLFFVFVTHDWVWVGVERAPYIKFGPRIPSCLWCGDMPCWLSVSEKLNRQISRSVGRTREGGVVEKDRTPNLNIYLDIYSGKGAIKNS